MVAQQFLEALGDLDLISVYFINSSSRHSSLVLLGRQLPLIAKDAFHYADSMVSISQSHNINTSR